MKSKEYQYILFFTLFEAAAHSKQLTNDEAQQILEKMNNFFAINNKKNMERQYEINYI